MQSPVPYAFERRPDRSGRRSAFALLIALALHAGLAALFLLLALIGFLRAPPGAWNEEHSPVALVGIPAAEWDHRRALAPPAPLPPQEQKTAKAAAPKPLPTPEPPKPKPEAMPKGQVVDVAPGNDQKPDESSRFLAEHNNRVAKESRAKETNRFYKNAMPQATTAIPREETTGHDATAQKQSSGNQGIADDDREKKASSEAAREVEIPDIQKRDQLALATEPHGEIHNETESEAVRGNAAHLRLLPGSLDPGAQPEVGSLGKKGDRNQINLMPSEAAVDKITGAAAPDKLDDVDEGDGTYLNTREFKYATFFNRVKQRVGENWDPSTPLRQRDPEGRIYAYKDRYTLLNIALDDRGRLLQVTIEKSCGVDFLDHEAIAAFERAQPFPNPPPGMLDSSGQVKFDFGFFLEVSSSSSLRIFRARD